MDVVYTQAFCDEGYHDHNSSPLFSGGGDASGSIESDASTVLTPNVDMNNQSQSLNGPKAKRHTTVDNKDILYCFLWAKRKAQQTYAGYAKIMFEKWNVLRPDKPLSVTALATKGKRLYDRASKDLGANGWLYMCDLREVENRVNEEWSGGEQESDDTNENCTSPNVNNCDENDKNSVSCPEFDTLYTRCYDLFLDLKSEAIEDQDRRVLKKKSFTSLRLGWMDKIFAKIVKTLNDEERTNLSLINTLLYVVAVVFTYKEGQEFACKPDVPAKKRDVCADPPWKVRLDKKLLSLRKEVDILQADQNSRLRQANAILFRDSVYKKYRIDGSRGSVAKVVFMLKNQITATAAKIRRYQKNMKAKHQNELFAKNKKKLYRSIFDQSESVSDPPSEAEVRQFWENEIWGESNLYSGPPPWLDEVKKACKGVCAQKWEGLSGSDVTNQLASQLNWKAAGIDQLPNFWLKNIPSSHNYLAACMDCFLTDPAQLPEWMVRGRTVMLPKSDKTSVASNYRPITCLNTMWKTLTGILSSKISAHLEKHSILAMEQQGAIKKSYGTKRQLLINRSIFEDAFRKKKNLSCAYIDYQKAYDSVPHGWIIEILYAYKVSDIIVNFLAQAMLKWQTDLFLYHDNGVVQVERVRIRRGIFQGDSLSPLLFIIAINPLSLLLNRRCSGYKLDELNITHCLYMDDLKAYSNSYSGIKMALCVIEQFSTDIGMSLGLGKCKVVNMKKGKYVALGGVMLKGGMVEELREDEAYKYLGVEELVGVRHEKMKDKVWAGAKVKLRKLLESELNSRNLFVAINECIMPIISYSFGIVYWLESDLKELDIKIRKMLNMYRVFEIKSDIDRLYVPRTAGGRGLQSVWDVYRGTICRLGHVLKNASCEVMQACAKVDLKGLFSVQKKAEKFLDGVSLELPEKFHDKSLLSQARVIANALRNVTFNDRLECWRSKPQHGAYLRLLDEHGLHVKHSLGWLNKIHLDGLSEAYVCAAQELALFTRYHEMHIIKTRNDDLCRICRKQPETIFHILSGCDVLSKREYFDRHNHLCQYIHYELLKHYGFAVGPHWYAHKPCEVILSKNVEIAYDQIITTDRPIGANRPDILIRDMVGKKTYIIDISCPCDVNVAKKENEKISKYGTLRKELTKMWNCECLIIPVVVGGLGAVSNDTEKHIKSLPGNAKLYMCQKITVIGSSRILQSVLSR